MASSLGVRAGSVVAQTEMGLLDYARPGSQFMRHECISSSSGSLSTSTSKSLHRLSYTGRLPSSVAVSVRSSWASLGYVGGSQTSSRGGRPRAASGSVQQEEIAAVGTMTVGQFVVQGLREEMEDEIAVDVDGPRGFSYAGIFDGHAGNFSAKYLRWVSSLLVAFRFCIMIDCNQRIS